MLSIKPNINAPIDNHDFVDQLPISDEVFNVVVDALELPIERRLRETRNSVSRQTNRSNNT